MLDEKLPIPKRVEHARRLLADSARFELVGYMAERARGLVDGGAAIDSLRFDFNALSPRLSFTEMIITNPSSTPIKILKFRIMDANGELSEEMVFNIPAKGRDRGYTRGRLALPVRQVRVVDVETGEI